MVKRDNISRQQKPVSAAFRRSDGSRFISGISSRESKGYSKGLGSDSGRISIWNPERIKLLKNMYNSGYSASIIAREIGGDISRNAVIAKIHRLRKSGELPKFPAGEVIKINNYKYKIIPCPNRSILNISPYVPGESHVAGVGKVFKLASNESPLGPSPAAMEAMRRAATKVAEYPDGAAHDLRAAIAEHHGLNPGNIVCGNGSDELLHLLAQAYLSPGDEAIYTEHGFLVYPIAIRAAGGVPVVAREENLTASVDAILESVSSRTKLVYLANPNNPTGTYLPIDELKRLQAELPPWVLLIIDAAYAEYVRRNDYEAGIELVSSCENVVMTRTFSKAYGLAGMRIGWMYAPGHVVDVINRIRGPFNVNALALAAGAAAMRDAAHLQKAVEHNEHWRDWLARELAALGLEVTPSVANFLLVHFPDEEGKRAKEADAFLRSRGLILRRMGGYGFPNALRVSIGTEEANRLLVDALREFLERS